MSKVHDFQQSLAWSKAQSADPVWERIYRQAFHDFESMTSHEENGWWQQAGIDRAVTLKSSKRYLIDEKARSREFQGDVLLEYLSSREHNRPGWVKKPLAADFIAYAWIPSSRCVLLPVPQLQKVWRENEAEWIALYTVPPANNSKYNTVSAAVPYRLLLSKMATALTIDWGDAA